MSYNEDCLLCLQRRVSYLPPREWIEKGNLPDFRTLCQYLKIKLTAKVYEHFSKVPSFVKYDDDKSRSNSTCDKFLCLDCFDLVYNLSKLYEEAEEIQRKITEFTSDIRNIVIKNSLEIPEPGIDSLRKRRSRKDRNSEFVALFQKLVKSKEENADLKTEQGSNIIVGSSTCGSEKRTSRRIKSSSNSNQTVTKQTPDESGVLLGDIKVEVDENDTLEDTGDAAVNDYYLDRNMLTNTDNESDPVPEILENVKVDFSMTGDTPYVNRVGLELKEETRKHKRKNIRKTDKNVPTSKTVRRRSKIRKVTPIPHFTCRDCKATFESSYKYYSHRKTHRQLQSKTLGIPTFYETKNNRRIVVRVCSICGHKSKGSTAALAAFMEHVLSHENDMDFADPSNCELHTCDLCNKQFNLKLNLDLHKICNHQARHVILKCEHCGDVNSKSREEFIDHLKTHSDSIHSCKSCPMSFTTLDKVLTHMVKHSKSRRLWCPGPECSFVSTSLKDVYKHCQSVHPALKEKFECTLCNKSFLSPTSFKAHMSLSHEENSLGEHRCPKCNNSKVYKTKKFLDNHLRHMHGDEESKPHKCDQCKKSFVYKSLLQQHIQKKHERIRYPCPHCAKSYTERHELSHHLKTHTGEGLYTCQTCGKKFARKGELQVHSIVHLVKSAENTCVCEVCGKEFGSVHRLRKHKNVHKDKQLECEHCGMKFRRQDHLRGHLRTHTGERPYICVICSKGFNRRDIMIVHMKVHGLSQVEAAEVCKRHAEENAN